jgi:signal transduction histidine kinase
MMLAILLLSRDWPAVDATAPRHIAAVVAEAQPGAFALPARTLSAQHRPDPMTGLLARVSHDLRTPLNAVMGLSDLMQQEAFGPLGDARYQSYARHIHASSAELLKATEDTLAMTSLVANPVIATSEVACLSDLMSDAFTMALTGMPKGQGGGAAAAAPAVPPAPVTLALTVASQLQVKCERRALRQAMINLFSAALRKVGTGEGVARTIHAKAVTHADVVCLTISVMPAPSAAVSREFAAGWNSAEDLPVCLARAMLDLQGLTLTMSAKPNLWSAQVLLDGVSQSDFFPS